jgi:hypothetical protein
MATTKTKPKQYHTPKGIFVYPYLVKPDFGTGAFANSTGIFKVNLRLSKDEAEPILEDLQAIYDEAIEEGKQKFAALKVEARKKLKTLTETPLFDEEYDKETEEPTGDIVFKFSTKASGISAKGEPWSRKIPLFAASGKPIKPATVGGGTIGKVSYEAVPYFIPATGVAGVKLYLVAAQILELSEGFGSGNAAQYGFGPEEGYEDAEDSADDNADVEGDEDSAEDDDQF